jgi:hypothetical protein
VAIDQSADQLYQRTFRAPLRAIGWWLLDRTTGHGRKLGGEPVGKASRDWELMLGFEFLDRRAGRLVECTGRTQLAVAEFRQHPLDRNDARRSYRRR